MESIVDANALFSMKWQKMTVQGDTKKQELLKKPNKKLKKSKKKNLLTETEPLQLAF